MLDKDLAELYEVKALRLRQQVKRNNERFPEHFMFRLTEEETDFTEVICLTFLPNMAF